MQQYIEIFFIYRMKVILLLNAKNAKSFIITNPVGYTNLFKCAKGHACHWDFQIPATGTTIFSLNERHIRRN
jgi:hypothetical protein